MPSLVRNIVAGILGSPTLLHPRETQYVTGNLGAINAEIVVDCDGSGAVSFDARGTFSMTVELAGSIDGVNWQLIPVKLLNGASRLFLTGIAGVTPASYMGACAGYRKVRARVTAYTSGTMAAVLTANVGDMPDSIGGSLSTNAITATAAVGVAVTATLPAPGVGLRQYLTGLLIERFATALMTAGAAPVIVTTTNTPGTPSFNLPADAAAAGAVYEKFIPFAPPLAAPSQNTALTIVVPATPLAIMKVTAFWDVAP